MPTDAEILEAAAEVLWRRNQPCFIQEPDPERVRENMYGFVDRTTALGVLRADAIRLRHRDGG